MNDKELLEFAAKAGGINLNDEMYSGWNPLEDDGDAFRLAILSGLDITVGFYWATAKNANVAVSIDLDDHEGERLVAARKAIVWAAAKIGKTL